METMSGIKILFPEYRGDNIYEFVVFNPFTEENEYTFQITSNEMFKFKIYDNIPDYIFEVVRFNSNSLLCLYTGEYAFIIDIKDREITNLDYKVKKINRGIWAYIDSSKIVFQANKISEPKTIKLSFFLQNSKNNYNAKLLWVEYFNDRCFVAFELVNRKKTLRKLLNFKNENNFRSSDLFKIPNDYKIRNRPLVLACHNSTGEFFVLPVDSTPMITYSKEGLLIYGLKRINPIYIANVRNFQWRNNYELVILEWDTKIIYLYNVKTKKRKDLFKSKYTTTRFCCNEDYIIFYSVDSGLEYFECLYKARFYLYDFKTCKIEKIKQFKKYKMDYYYSMRWDCSNWCDKN